MASVTPPFPDLPPSVRRQMATRQTPVFMAAGQNQAAMGQGQPGQAPSLDGVSQLEAKLGELESVTSDIMKILSVVHPPSAALLVPIAQAGKALQATVAELKARSGGQSPQTTAPQPNPAEAQPQGAISQ